jgi:hypothetical protein
VKKIRAIFSGDRGLPKESCKHGGVHYIRDLGLTVGAEGVFGLAHARSCTKIDT